MRIGLVADTHMTARAAGLPRALVEGLRGVDLILHAGDWVSPESVELLERIAPVDGVAGNNDGEALVRRFGRRKIVGCGGCRIGIVHGDGMRGTTERRARDAFRDEPVDLILFGHSHNPLLEREGGIWLVNPGSPTDKRRQPAYSYAILTVEPQLSVRHYAYTDKSV